MFNPRFRFVAKRHGAESAGALLLEHTLELFGKGHQLRDFEPDGTTHAVILVHGFNGRESKVVENYLRIAAVLGVDDFKIIGYLWNSRGRIGIGAYYADRITAKRRAHQELRKGIMELTERGFKTITILAHSMGSIVAMRATAPPGPTVNVILHAGDAIRRRFRPGKAHGSGHCHVTNYYSRFDITLDFARILFPWVRVGEMPLPNNYVGESDDFDASAIALRRIHHTDYKRNKDVLGHTRGQLLVLERGNG